MLTYLNFAKGTDPVDLLSEKVIGCTERCPFCNTPCKYNCKNHAGDHSAPQHCPGGVKGYRDKATGIMVISNCESFVASDSTFANAHTSGSSVPYKQYRKYYPNWEIAPSRDMKSSLYWKWFVSQFHDDLLKHFNMKPAKYRLNG